MAFPQVAAVNGGNNTTNSTEHTVNLPSGIQAGDLLLVFFASDVAPTIAFPEGWTQLFQTSWASLVNFGAWYRVADGNEGATITVTTSSEEMTAHTSYRITGYIGVPEVGTAATGSTITPDPPSLSPSWGAQDTLWLAACANDRERFVATYPDDYTDGLNDLTSGKVEGCGVGTARRERNTATENPGAFTISVKDECVANTVAIQPGVAGWTGKAMGVTNPAKVMGVDVANIAKVHGVA